MRHLIVAAVVLSLADSAMAETWTVDDDGPADFDNIQAAVDAASDGDEIVVEPGVYIPGFSSQFNIVEIFGKGLTLRSSGGPSVTTIGPTRTGGVVIYAPGSPCTVDGFTITGTGVDSYGSALWFGGGGTFLVANCHIVNNGLRGISVQGEGGTDSISITNCLIAENARGSLDAIEGGGVKVDNVGGAVVLQDCTIQHNGGGPNQVVYGGGLLCENCSNVTVTDCLIADNVARYWEYPVGMGGGVYIGGISNVVFDGCTIQDNQSYEGGGGISTYGGGSNITITGCSIVQNSENGGFGSFGGGGVLNVGNSSVTIAKSDICGNTPDQIEGPWQDLGGNEIGILCVGSALQWSAADGGNGHWYALNRGSIDWATAAADAAALGGHLVTCTIEEENSFVRTNIIPCGGTDDTAWMGGVLDSAGNWSWSTSESWAYQNWLPSEPNEVSPQAAVCFDTSATQECGWADYDSSESIDGYVIEWSADCNSDGIVDWGQILDGSLADLNGDGIPDCCEAGTCLDNDPDTSHWIDAAGGSFNDSNNWSDSVVPGVDSTVLFYKDAAYTIDFPSAAETLNLRANSGDVTLDLGTNQYSLSGSGEAGLIVGELLGDTASLAVTNGRLNVVEAYLGLDWGASGAIAVSGSGTEMVVSGQLGIGNRGLGMLSVDSGATLRTFTCDVGYLTNSHGMVSLSGDDTRWLCESTLSIKYGEVDVASPASIVLDTGQFVVAKGGTLRGNGDVTAGLINYGNVAPRSASPPMQFYGTYTQSGIFQVGLNTSGHSQLDVVPGGAFTGWASLSGGLIAEIEDDLDPEIGAVFPILNADFGLAGTFEVAFMPDLGHEKYMTVEYRDGRGVSGADLVVGGYEDVLGFGDPESLPLGGDPLAMVVADFDADSDNDIAVSTSGVVTIYFNNTVFDTSITLDNDESDAVDLASGDFNGDGFIDLVGANATDDAIVVFLNNGDGTFLAGTVVSTGVGTLPQGVAAADFNNDGQDDIAVSCYGTGTVQVWQLSGGGLRSVVFIQDVDLAVGDGPLGIDPGQVEEDKDMDRIDLVIAIYGEDSVGTLRNNSLQGGTIAFLYDEPIDKHATGSGPTELALGDLDGDGRLDIVTANPSDGTISVLLHQNSASAEFMPSVDLPVGAGARAVSIADLDDDGDQDIAVIAAVEGETVPSLQVLRNGSSETSYEQLLISPAEAFAIGGMPVLVDCSDIDDDSVPDLITINLPGSGLRFPLGSLNLVGSTPGQTCDGDLNGDYTIGIDDLLLLLANFGSSGVGDLNADGIVDINDLLQMLGLFGQDC